MLRNTSCSAGLNIVGIVLTMIETSMSECVMSIHGTEFIQSDGEVSSYTVFLSDLTGLRVNEIHCDGSA